MDAITENVHEQPLVLVIDDDPHVRTLTKRLLERSGKRVLLAENGNPQVDVLFGGPVETFTAGEEQGIFEAYTPPSAADLPRRFKSERGMWWNRRGWSHRPPISPKTSTLRSRRCRSGSISNGGC